MSTIGRRLERLEQVQRNRQSAPPALDEVIAARRLGPEQTAIDALQCGHGLYPVLVFLSAMEIGIDEVIDTLCLDPGDLAETVGAAEGDDADPAALATGERTIFPPDDDDDAPYDPPTREVPGVLLCELNPDTKIRQCIPHRYNRLRMPVEPLLRMRHVVTVLLQNDQLRDGRTPDQWACHLTVEGSPKRNVPLVQGVLSRQRPIGGVGHEI